jgi:ribonuclease HII
MKLPSKTLEKNIFKSGYQIIYAVDEVGIGCLAGPVVTCAIGFTNHFYNKIHNKLHRIRDSKLLLPNQREKFAKELMKEKDLVYTLAYSKTKTIDKINIYNAARLAMKRAVLRLVNSGYKFQNPRQNIYKKYSNLKDLKNLKNPNLNVASNFALRASDLKSIVLVDGKAKIKNLNIEQLPIVKGDRKVFAIACASIIAKVYRDKMMVRYAKKYPDYGFEKHKGYGTKSHLAILANIGPCEIHRKSFAPIKKII